jgi:hypothetical protein
MRPARDADMRLIAQLNSKKGITLPVSPTTMAITKCLRSTIVT